MTIGDGVLSGSRVIISDHSHGIYSGPEQSSPEIRPVERRTLKRQDRDDRTQRVAWGMESQCSVEPTSAKAAVIGANSVVTGIVLPSALPSERPPGPSGAGTLKYLNGWRGPDGLAKSCILNGMTQIRNTP